MNVVHAAQALGKELEVIPLGKACKLRDIVQANIDEFPRLRLLQTAKEVLGGGFGKSDSKYLNHVIFILPAGRRSAFHDLHTPEQLDHLQNRACRLGVFQECQALSAWCFYVVQAFRHQGCD